MSEKKSINEGFQPLVKKGYQPTPATNRPKDGYQPETSQSKPENPPPKDP